MSIAICSYTSSISSTYTKKKNHDYYFFLEPVCDPRLVELPHFKRDALDDGEENGPPGVFTP